MTPPAISLGLAVFLLFVAGYSTQRASVCAVAAAEEVVRDRRANRLVGAMFSAAVSATLLCALAVAGLPVFAGFTGYPASTASIGGGVIFAVGAWVNGRCAMGTLAELAAGHLRRVATIAGMVAGAWAGFTLTAGSGAGTAAMPAAAPLIGAVAPLPALAMASALCATLFLLMRRGLRNAPPPQFWHPAIAVALAGMASGLLFALDRHWPYTSLIADIASGKAIALSTPAALALVVLAASCIAAVRGGLFRWRVGSIAGWVRALAGGLGMGVGTSLVPGGNDSMLYLGLPFLLPHLASAYVACIGTLVALAWVTRRRPLNG